MRLPAKLPKTEVSIDDFYAIKIGSLWRTLRKENAAFIFLCFYLFLEYVRPASLYPVIDVLPWMQLTLLLTAATALLDKNIKWVKSPATFLFFAFILTVLVSGFFAFRPPASFGVIEVPLLWMFIYLLIINIVNTEKRLILFLLLFFLVNFKMSQHGFVTFAMRGFSYSAWGVTGSPGWFRNAGDFGIAMAIFVPLILSFILALQENWGRYKRWVFYFVAITAAVSILASSSRGAQLGIIATALWFVLKSKKAVKAILIAAVVGVIVYFSLSDEMLAEYRDMGGDSTSENRLAHWAWGSDVFKNNPVIGVGYNNWLVHCDFYNPNGVYAEGSRGRCLLPHNTYVELLAEMGSVGMLFYLLIIFYMLKQNSKTRSLVREKEDNFSFYISHGLDGALIAYLVSSVFYSVLFYPFLWINLSMTVVLYQVTKRTIEQKM